MADGLGNQKVGGMDTSFWAAQGELARQVTELAKSVGTVAARVEDRVTHKELMTTVGEVRKEVANKADHMEGKFDQATDKVESLLDRAVDRMKDTMLGVVKESVEKAMAAQRNREQDALATVQRNEADLEQRIRRANRNSLVGGLVGAGGFIAALAQYLQGAG